MKIWGPNWGSHKKQNEIEENWSSLVSIVMDSLTPPSKNLNIVLTGKNKNTIKFWVPQHVL